MRLLAAILLINFLYLNSSFASPCVTIEGLEYTCGSTKSKLDTILSNLVISKNTAYIYNGRDKVVRHIIQYSDSSGEAINSYFQDYIYNTSRGFYHLVHFVKNTDSGYSVYLETDILPTGSLIQDTTFVSENVKFLGSSTDLSFDDDGYPSATIITATDKRRLISNRLGLNFSIVGELTENYRLLYRLN